jgi:hypothetical protein
MTEVLLDTDDQDIGKMDDTPAYDELFPAAECIAAAGELSAWTTVQHIAAAARCLAGTPAPADNFDGTLIIPFADSDVLERIIVEVMSWLIASYRVPEPKITLAQSIEPAMTDVVRAMIAKVEFRSTVKAAPSGSLIGFAPVMADQPTDRFMLVEDEPYVIELLQGPLRAMMGLIRSTYKTATGLRDLKVRAADTGSQPRIYHRPHADSRLPAVVEALSFYALGLDLGPKWSAGADFDHAYRAVNVHGRPPFDPAMLAAARSATSIMLASLK